MRDFAINEFNDRVASADFAEALNESESTENNKCSKICEFDCVEWDTGGIAGLDLKLADVDRALEATVSYSKLDLHSITALNSANLNDM